MRKIITLTLLAGLVAFAGPVQADAQADVKAAYAKFIQANSFRADMTDLDTGKRVNQIEFVAPDRFAVQMDGGLRQVIIGRTMYMDLGGRIMSMPLPASIDPAQYRNQKALDELADGVTVTQRPDSNEAGEPARVYHFVSQVEGKPVESLTFVSKASGMPIQIQTTGGKAKGKFRYQIRYRDFNDPGIVIRAPK
jgi:outer membrane lipoprotein-sorting protein